MQHACVNLEGALLGFSESGLSIGSVLVLRWRAFGRCVVRCVFVVLPVLLLLPLPCVLSLRRCFGSFSARTWNLAAGACVPRGRPRSLSCVFVFSLFVLCVFVFCFCVVFVCFLFFCVSLFACLFVSLPLFSFFLC